MGMYYFVSGILVGASLALVILLYFLLQTNAEEQTKDPIKEAHVLKENDLDEEQKNILVNAVSILRGDEQAASQIETHPTEEAAPLEFTEMDTAFTDFAKEAKDRQKHTKSLCSFLQEFGRVHGQFAKDLTKLSNSAETYVKADNNVVLDKWWNSMSIALEHLSKDQKSISTTIMEEIYPNMLHIEQEQLHLEKKVSGEGSKLLQKMKDTQQMYDAKVKELERLREKSHITTISSAPLAVTTSSTPSTGAAAATNCQTSSQNRSLAIHTSDGPGSPGGEAAMVSTSPAAPMTDHDQRPLSPAPSSVGSPPGPTAVAGTAPQPTGTTAAGGGGVTVQTGPAPSKALATKLATSEAAVADWSDKLAAVQQDFNEKMPRILEDYKLMAAISLNSMMELLIQLSDQLAVAQEKSSQVTHRLKVDLASSAAKSKDRCNYNPVVRQLLEDILHEQADGDEGKLDMKLESSAGLAASCLAQLPPLPRRFEHCVGSETCVWFNALSGRMYRDAARSAWFNTWFCTKITNLLNKGKRSPVIDKYNVVDVTFGSIPPLLLNVKWSPIRPTDTRTSESGALPPPDLEYDVECTADVAFRSSLAFTVQTNSVGDATDGVLYRLWINWPRPKCAFVPVSIKLEVSELCGAIRFGVRRGMSFMSFVDEPYTRFSVQSEVGDQYKLKNLPKLSSVIVNKLKQHIKKRMVYPNSFKFRLIWPRTWWPEGSEHLFRSETVVPQPAPAVSRAPSDQDDTTQLLSTPNNDGSRTDKETVSSTADTAASTGSARVDDDTAAKSTGKGGAKSHSTTREHVMRWFSRPYHTQAKKSVPTSTLTSSTGDTSFDAERKVSHSVRNALDVEGVLHEKKGTQRQGESNRSNVASDMSHNNEDNEEVSEAEALFASTQKLSRSRSEGRRLGSSPTSRMKHSLVAQDHVRMYVSSLLASAASGSKSSVFLAHRAADDICVRDKQFASESIAIVRTRAHSIADLRHVTLEGMWSEFLGSIGHDFVEYQSQMGTCENYENVADEYVQSSSHGKGSKHRFGTSLMSLRSKLLGGGSRILRQHSSRSIRHGNTAAAEPQEFSDDDHDVSVHSHSGYDTPGVLLSSPDGGGANSSDGGHSGGSSTHNSSASHEGAGILRFGKKILNTQRALATSSQQHDLQLQVDHTSHQSVHGMTSTAGVRATTASVGAPAAASASSPISLPSPGRHATDTVPGTKASSASATGTMISSPLSGIDPHHAVASSTSGTTTTSTGSSSGASTSTPSNTSKSTYGHKLGLVVGAMGAIAEGVRAHKKDRHIPGFYQSSASASSSRGRHLASAVNKGSVDDLDETELEKEVMNLTWQAHALAISQAAEKGEAINMQNFMHTPYPDSPKQWIVMRDGFLIIFPNATHEAGAVEKGQPVAKYNLAGCTCRPLEQPLGFEVGFVVGSPIRDSMVAPKLNVTGASGMSHGGETDMEWVQFWTETDIQCRAWVMALQHSADLRTDGKRAN